MLKQIIYGIHVIENLILKNPKLIKCIYITKITTRIEEIIKKANKLKIKYILIKNLKTKNLYEFKKNENILCKVKNTFKHDLNTISELIKKKQKNIILILNEIQDTNNLGACIRTAEAANITCIIIIKNKSATINSTVIKVSCGATFFIPIIEIKNIHNVIKFLKKHNIKILGSSSKGEKDIYNINIKDNIAIILGPESKGINNDIKKKCDLLIKIPTSGICGSLNVSVATGIILFEIKRKLNYKSKFVTDNA